MTPADLEKCFSTRTFPPLLLLYGEESFLIDRTLHRLRDLLVPEEARDFNYHLFRGREARVETVLDAARTLPIFSPRRLIVFREVDEVPAGELDSFLSYLRDPAPETVLVLVAGKIDGRRKFYQEFRKCGEQVEFRRLYDNQIPAFVREQARAAGVTLTEDAMALFCRRVGTGLQEVYGELAKLCSYLGEKKLADVADVTAVVSDTRADSVFDLTNAIGEEKTGEALLLLRRLLEEGVAPLVILTMLARHFRQLWMARELLDRGTPAKEIARQIGLNPYFVDGVLAQARRFSTERCRQAFDLLLAVDLALKSSGAHPSALLETLVLELGGKRNR